MTSRLFCLPALAALICLPAGELPAQGIVPPAHDAEQGNWRDAYDRYRQALLEESAPHAERAAYVQQAVRCLGRLNRHADADGLLEAVAARYPQQGAVLRQVALEYLRLPHHGALVEDEFRRGNQRGRAKLVNCVARDRVRALQLLRQAMTSDHPPAEQVAWRDLAETLLRDRNGSQAWSLQLLTDLSELPDYEEGWYHRPASAGGAPVDANGQPVLHEVPQTWEAATSDGQRWRYALAQFATAGEYQRLVADRMRAEFLQTQFGVETLGNVLPLLARARDENSDQQDAIFALHTLTDEETIARLASGVRRFKLPDDHNPLKIYQHLLQQVQAGNQHGLAPNLAGKLAEIYKNRRQFPHAAKVLPIAIEHSSGRTKKRYQEQLDQIVGNWGEFEPAGVQPAGQGAQVGFRYRNARQVEFVAQPIDVRQLLSDVKRYVESRPDRLDWQTLNLTDLSSRMLQANQQKYLGDETASWSFDLDPPADHFDAQTTVTTPLQAAGAFWVTAKVAGGNTCHIPLWVADLALVAKPLDGKRMYFVADAVTGQLAVGAKVEFFGYRQQRSPNRPNQYQIETRNFADTTDANGMVRLDQEDFGLYQWLAIASTADGRAAFLGFEGLGRHRLVRHRLNEAKAYLVTDRPVYRPDQTVHFKAWIQRARYGQDETSSEFARQSFRVEIHDGRGERVHQATLTANAYGAIQGEYELPLGATLGQYRISVLGHGSGWFRVEEYKKPEYEVTVDAPSDPVKLGEAFVATIKANYYFGAPVVHATVKYKVTRTKHDTQWWPPRPWDWLYGPGYWWFGNDYGWYPGFERWGCRGPIPPWWHWHQPAPPEVVAQGESPIGPAGELAVPIDTALAQAMHGDSDHRYHIEAQVVDASRRTIVGTGSVLAARQPFHAYVWTTGGYYRVGATIELGVATRTADGQPLSKAGTLALYKIAYGNDGEDPQETEVRNWELVTDTTGAAALNIKASEPGQYRLSFTAKTDDGQVVEGGHVFTIMGPGADGSDFRFNDLEIIPDKQQYAPGETVRLQINTNRTGGTVLLFVRPENGTYPEPQVVRLKGKSTVVDVPVEQADRPNLLVEACCVSGARVHQVLKDIAVPPVSKVLNVELVPTATAFRPGQEARVQLRLTDQQGNPVVGDTTLTIYDKSVEYISGGSNAGDIRKFFWDWRRSHHPNRSDSLAVGGRSCVPDGMLSMQPLGMFGGAIPPRTSRVLSKSAGARMRYFSDRGMPGEIGLQGVLPAAAPAMAMVSEASAEDTSEEQPDALVEPRVRTEFADTALWAGSLETNEEGIAEVALTMPENLTTWKIMAWGLGHGARVGHGASEVVTRKDLIVRLQTPRFLVETDEVVLSANVHNYLDTAKQVTVRLELAGGALEAPSQLEQQIEVPAGEDRRIDWRVKAVREGEAQVTAIAQTDQESDAMQLKFPVRVHGMLKQESFSGVIAQQESHGTFEIEVPAERRAEQSRLEIRYSPTLAGAMLDALPYLIDYPHGCTEQTLNRFLPAVITQHTILTMGVDLRAIGAGQTNLNPQEVGPAAERRAGWRRYDRCPVFNPDQLDEIVKSGVRRLTEMQLSDGGWGWFSGYGEHSSAHTTATVVRGLIIAERNGVALVPGVLDRGIAWLGNYQAEQIAALENYGQDGQVKQEGRRAKRWADNLDVLVHLTLVENGKADARMRDLLYRDRTHLAPYGLAMLGIALEKERGQADKRDMVIRNLKQFVVQDAENQTAYLDLPGGYWWYWYGSEFEAHAYFLKLLSITEPDSELASGLVKYLLNNRKHSTYWNSTRDTALVVEAMADYLAATAQAQPEMTIEVWIDGEKRKEVRVTADNLFSFDNAMVLEGVAVEAGRHTIELRKQGTGRLYYNAYLSNFTLEDDIRRAGLEVRVRRRLYKLEPIEAAADVAGAHGQALTQPVEKYERKAIRNLGSVNSGDLIEVELTLESKNDYEYLLITDHKPAGFEPVEVRSGYNGNEIGAYVEYRDEVVNLFARQLARGERSVSYRLRAEAPGKFSALPTVIQAMYAPELRGSSDEIKVNVKE